MLRLLWGCNALSTSSSALPALLRFISADLSDSLLPCDGGVLGQLHSAGVLLMDLTCGSSQTEEV